MVNYFARARRNRGAWLEALLVDQSRAVERANLDDLTDFAETVKGATHALIALDNPAPARGYAIVLPTYYDELGNAVDGAAIARVHVVENTPDDAYRALFSQMHVQTKTMRSVQGLPFKVRVYVDPVTAAAHVADAVERLGGAYNVLLGSRSLTPESVDEGSEDVHTEVEVQVEIEKDADASSEAVVDAAAEAGAGVDADLVAEGVDPELANEVGETVAEIADQIENGEPIEIVQEEQLEDDAAEAPVVSGEPVVPQEEPSKGGEGIERYDFVGMTKAELVTAAKELGFSSKGSATELRQRLLAEQDAVAEPDDDE